MTERSSESFLWSWGWGEFGRLGHGDTESKPSPEPLGHEALRTAVLIACGGHHTIAITEEGSVVSWGWGNEGQLGSGNNFDQLYPGVVKSLVGQRVVTVACGYYHTVAVTDSGTVHCWGKGNCGQLGLGELAGCLLPRTITSLHSQKVQVVDCGMAHTLAVTEDGVVYAWGQGTDGQLGVGKLQDEDGNVSSPVTVVGLEGISVTAVACGSRHSFCISSDGNVYSWGLGDDGRLGHGDSGSRFVPCHVEGIKTTRISGGAAGGHHSCVVAESGQVLTCGRGTYGQLGHGDSAPSAVFKPVRALWDIRVVKVSCGDTHSLALTSAGEVYSWGAGEDGQLGLGDQEDQYIPKLVCGLSPIGDIACGLVHSAVVPAQISSANSKVLELEESVRQLTVQLKNSESQLQAERKARLLAERKLQEVTHQMAKKEARRGGARGGIDWDLASVTSTESDMDSKEGDFSDAGTLKNQVSTATVSVQTEGYLIIPGVRGPRLGADSKSAPVTATPSASIESMKIAESVHTSKNGAKSAHEKAQEREALLKRATELQKNRDKGAQGAGTKGLANHDSKSQGVEGISERREKQAAFLNGLEFDQDLESLDVKELWSGTEQDDLLLDQELNGDDVSDHESVEPSGHPEIYLPSAQADGELESPRSREAAPETKNIHQKFDQGLSRMQEAKPASKDGVDGSRTDGSKSSKTAKMFGLTRSVRAGVTGFLREIRDELVADRPVD